MERQKSFEVLDFDGEFFKQNENSTIESTELISDGVSHDESRSYTELSESDYSENSLSASKSDLIKLDFDQNQTIVEQSSTSHEVDKSYSSSSFSMPSTEMKASDMHDQLQIQLSKDLDTNISDRIRFYFHDFLLGSILFSLFLGHMLYSEQCNRKYIVETKRIAEYEVERIQLLTNISVLSSEISRKDTMYAYLETKHKQLKNITHQLRLDLSTVTAELRDRTSAYGKLKLDYKHTKGKMRKLTNELKKLKIALMDLKRSSLFFPGARVIKDILCKILSICPDLDG